MLLKREICGDCQHLHIFQHDHRGMDQLGRVRKVLFVLRCGTSWPGDKNAHVPPGYCPRFMEYLVLSQLDERLPDLEDT